MHFLALTAVSLPILGALALPGWPGHNWPPVSTVTETVNVTATITDVLTKTYTITATPSCSASHSSSVSASSSTVSSSTSSSSPPPSQPTAPYTVIAARSGSPVHLLPWTASGFLIHLGGTTASYCPASQVGAACPAGDVTAFAGTCGMDVEVPGGQTLYILPSGALGYTQAHSASIPTGAIECPLTYSSGSTFGDIGTTAFNATGFMACPGGANATAPYQVFASFPGAQVPTGDVADCIGFDALAYTYSGVNGSLAAAWQYT